MGNPKGWLVRLTHLGREGLLSFTEKPSKPQMINNLASFLAVDREKALSLLLSGKAEIQVAREILGRGFDKGLRCVKFSRDDG